MSLKKIGLALVASLALGALMASSASAAVETVAAQWYTGAGPTTLAVGTTKTVTGKVAEHPVIGKKGELTTTIATLPVKLTSTGFECVGCTIQNKAVNGKKETEPTTTEKANVIAYGSGKIKFTGVTVDEPVNCTVKSSETGTAGVIETKDLVIHGDWMDTNKENSKAFIQFLPKAGPTAAFASFFLEGEGCKAIKGTYNVTGSVFGESANNTGVGAVTQNLTFSPAVQTTTGAQLKVGANTANFTGTGAFSLSSEESFQIK